MRSRRQVRARPGVDVTGFTYCEDMGAFDEDWWDERISGGRGGVDLTEVDFGSEVGAWSRWRLVDELMTRFYVDFGLEGFFGDAGEASLYQLKLASPSCAKAPRYFGRLCANGPHVAVDEDTPTFAGVNTLTPFRVQAPPDGDLPSHSKSWPHWSAYREQVIADLGLAGAGVVGHEHCFHRRGRSAAQLAFRLAVLLRTANGNNFASGFDLAFASRYSDAALRQAAPWFHEVHPPGAPRWLLVTNHPALAHSLPEAPDQAVTAWIVTNEGRIHHRQGTTNARDEWRSGKSETEIVAALTGVHAA